jgi:TonB family protein
VKVTHSRSEKSSAYFVPNHSSKLNFVLIVLAGVISVTTLWMLPILDIIFASPSRKHREAIRLVHYIKPTQPKIHTEQPAKHKLQKKTGFDRQFPEISTQVYSTPLEISHQFDFSQINESDHPDLKFAVKEAGASFSHFKLGGLGFKLSQVDVLPVALNKLRPNYPFHARRRGLEGEVLLSFVITENGTVSHLHVLRSSPAGVFDESARQAVKDWKFRPAQKGGEAVPVMREQLIRFGLEK